LQRKESQTLKNQTTLSERIKALRKEKNMTQLELAAKLNITDKAVSKWEAAEGNPDISILAKLGEIFGVTIDYLLTGKVPEEKIVVMSKAELCARNDDVNLLEEIMQQKALPDEKGATVLDYALKYTSIKVFKELSNRGFTYFEVRSPSRRTVYAPEPPMPSNAKDMMRMYMLSGCLGNLPQLGIKPIAQWMLREWNKEMLNLVLSDALPQVSKDIIFGMHKQNGENRPKSPSGIITGAPKQAVVNWPIVYSKLMEMAVIEDRRSQAEFIQALIGSINETTFRLEAECLENKKPFIHATNIDPADIKDERAISRSSGINESFIRTVSAKHQPEYSSSYTPNTRVGTARLYSVTYSKVMLDNLLNEDIERLKPFNENNKKTGGFHFSDKEMEIARMKKERTHTPDDIFVFSCVEHGILNIEKLLASSDLQLIKRTLYAYPMHYFEVLKKIIDKNDPLEIFRAFIDIGFTDCADAVLLEQSHYGKIDKPDLDEKALRFMNLAIGRDISRNASIEPAVKAAIMIQEANMAYIAKKHKLNLVVAGLFDPASNTYRAHDSCQLISFLADCRTAIIQELSGKIDTQRLESELTHEYFEGLIGKGETELVIIKLVLLLESKLKVNYQLNGELNEMIDAYCRKTDTSTSDLLHRLRMMRNNLVHSETNKVKPLSEQELRQCVELITKM